MLGQTLSQYRIVEKIGFEVDNRTEIYMCSRDCALQNDHWATSL